MATERKTFRPGFQGKDRDRQFAEWNQIYGEGNWRIAWELADGQVLGFEEVFWQVYVAGYVRYFLAHPEEATYLTDNYSYAYDKDPVGKQAAFDPRALYERPGRPNQFHHVALNVALEWFLGMPFRGTKSLQVRQGKPEVPQSAWPKGWRWSPGLIPTVRPDLIPETEIAGWWQRGTIEALYQCAKIVQIKNEL